MLQNTKKYSQRKLPIKINTAKRLSTTLNCSLTKQPLFKRLATKYLLYTIGMDIKLFQMCQPFLGFLFSK